MKFADSRWIKRLLTFRPEPEEQAQRIVNMQLRIVLPAKAGIIAVILAYVFTSGWTVEAPSAHDVALDYLRKYFLVYTACNLGIGGLFVWRRHSPARLFQWLVFILGLLDGLFVSGLVIITDGFASIAYWLFPVLIVLNAISIPLATPQIVLNLLLGFFYLCAGLLFSKVPLPEYDTSLPLRLQTNSVSSAVSNGVVGTNFSGQMTNSSRMSSTNRARNFAASAVSNGVVGTNFSGQPANSTRMSGTNRPGHRNSGSANPPTKYDDNDVQPDFPKVFMLWLLTACCYGAQVLRRTIEESREFAVREGQLLYAGRLSAEFAHQIKNPLAIINNAVYSMQRAVKEGRTDILPQLEIIREEVERSDKVITQIMGYAQLSEGHVEKLDLVDEVNSAVDETFPAAVETGVRIERRYAPHLPPLLMQRQHLSQILVNILQNAREALHGKGRVTVSVSVRRDESVEIVVADDGPGIAPDRIERVFEQYYSTKEKGTGLGLAIVKHNVELYAGRVRAESELGKGARFILTFPPKTVMKV